MIHALFLNTSQRFVSIPSCLHHSVLNLMRFLSTLHHHQTQVVSFIAHNYLVDFFDNLLQQCTTVQHCKQVHTHVIVNGKCHSAFLSARIISVYARFGTLFDAQKVFDTTPFECFSNLLLWNSILRANVSHENYENALKLYWKMRKLGVLGDGFTYPLVIKVFANMSSFSLCRGVHCHAVEMGFEGHLHVANELMGMYSKLGEMGHARNVFDKMGIRSHVSWNLMISGYAFNYDCHGALEMFHRMESAGLVPNLVTWTSLLSSQARCGRHEETLEFFHLMRMRGIGVNAEALAVALSVCADMGAVYRGQVIHGYLIKGGFEAYSFVKNALICLYGKSGDVNIAWNLFTEMDNKNLVSWNALITSYAEAGLCDKALEIFSQMEISKDCQELRPNVISWSAVIDGFASKGRGEESLQLFRQMQNAKVTANSVTISTVLSVCAELAALNLGREIHGHVIRALMAKNILVENGLVNMYMKCGSLKEGELVFDMIENKDLISWNSMIAGYGMHGLGVNAQQTFHQMLKSGSNPDDVTFVAVLSACSHAGLITEGRRCFDQMLREYGIEPQMEHFACMVDLLGRAGLLQEAAKIVENMPMKPNAFVWSALLNSCRMHKNMEIAEATASNIFNNTDLETTETGSYMLLSNIYAASGRWEDSAKIRASARTMGLKKNPGQSWIEVNKNVYMFSAGNNMQKELAEAYGIVEELALQMESEGFVPDNIVVLQSVYEENRATVRER